MFDHLSNPEHLIESLIQFVDMWRGIRSWYGVSPNKLGEVPLPKPLRQLYGALGNMPGRDGEPFAFGHQDFLLPFEQLHIDKGKLLFAYENQGCWHASTCLEGDDPPVTIRADESEPEFEHPSIANFLVTLCLQELTLGCPVTYAGDGLRQKFERAGYRVNPLWLDGLYPVNCELYRPTFYLIQGRTLMFNDWIGFQSHVEAEPYRELLSDARCIHPPKTSSMAAYLSQPNRNPMVARIYYDRLARDFQTQANELQAKANEYRRAADLAQTDYRVE